jgi:PAS domain S-box-containing protein
VAPRAKRQGAAAQSKQKKRGASAGRNRKIGPQGKRAMAVRRQTVRSKPRRTSKKLGRLDDRKIVASAGGAARELIRADMNKMKAVPRASRKVSGNGEVRRDAATKRSASAPIFKHPKTELEAAIRRYVDLFEFAPIPYVSFDRVGRIEEINLAAAQLLGGSRARVIGEPFALRVTKEDRRRFLNHLLRCRSSDRRVETELHLKKRNGEIILAHLASSPITSSMRDGALLYQTAIVDLTERKRAEEAIRESEERYRTLFDLGPMAVYTIDTSGVIRDFNRHAAELWGREPALGDTDQRFCGSFKMFRPDGSFMPHHQCPMAEVVLGKISAVHNGEVLIERPDGSQVTVLVNIRPLKNDLGEVTGAINCFYDITERKRAEEALRKSEEHLRAIINQSNAGIASCDLNGRFLFANQRFREMLGYTNSELAARTIFTVTHPDDVAVTKRRFGEMVQRRRPIEIEKRYIRKDRSLMWVNVCDTPVLDAAGNPVSAVAVAIDITERRRAKAALQRSNELLEGRVRQRTKALRMANAELKHEIERRKGLEGEILSLSDREQQRLGQELHDGLCQHLTAVAFMARSVAVRLRNHRVIDANDIDKIAELVNNAAADTRNLSRALHRADVDSAGLVEALRDLVDREIWRTPCRLVLGPSFHIDDDAAAAQLYRIAREAVINANKHAQAREIVIKLERSQQGMVLRVIDDGVGFSIEPKLKQGLGYHIMTYRAQLIGGHLKIERPKKGGTCVSCYFPDNAQQSHKPDATKSKELTRLSRKLTKALATLV